MALSSLPDDLIQQIREALAPLRELTARDCADRPFAVLRRVSDAVVFVDDLALLASASARPTCATCQHWCAAKSQGEEMRAAYIKNGWDAGCGKAGAFRRMFTVYVYGDGRVDDYEFDTTLLRVDSRAGTSGDAPPLAPPARPATGAKETGTMTCDGCGRSWVTDADKWHPYPFLCSDCGGPAMAVALLAEMNQLRDVPRVKVTRPARPTTRRRG